MKVCKAAEVPVVVVIKNNIVFSARACEDGPTAEKVFLDACKEHISNFDEYTEGDIEDILENGYETFGNGSVCLTWADA